MLRAGDQRTPPDAASSSGLAASVRPGAPAVEVDGLSKSYGDKVIIDDVTFAVRSGEFFSLLGPSGCGKTTTLRTIGGFVAPEAGTVRIDGEDVLDVPAHRRRVNTVFQSYALFPHLTVADNVAFGLQEQRVERSKIRERVSHALALVRLGEFGDRKPKQLSGGQQQRVALARALVMQPAVLLLDEPMGALDLKLRKAMQIELKGIQRDVGISFIHVTHDQEEALTMSDRIGIMADGRLLQVGTPAEIYERPRTRFVADFVGMSSFLEGVRSGSGFTLTCGTTVQVDDVSASPDSPILSLRPEAVAVATERPSDGALNAIRARVERVIYEGPSVSYRLALEGGGELLASEPNCPGSQRTCTAAAGAEVWASWHPTAGRLVENH